MIIIVFVERRGGSRHCIPFRRSLVQIHSVCVCVCVCGGRCRRLVRLYHALASNLRYDIKNASSWLLFLIFENDKEIFENEATKQRKLAVKKAGEKRPTWQKGRQEDTMINCAASFCGNGLDESSHAYHPDFQVAQSLPKIS